jgi:hypothetical protein
MTSFDIIIIMGILGVVAVLATGLFSMAYGGKFDIEHGTELMAVRVGIQLTVFLCLLIGMTHTI